MKRLTLGIKKSNFHKATLITTTSTRGDKPMQAEITQPSEVRKGKYLAALLKVASRCNLNCDYCYVYQHKDQSWENQPKLMAKGTVQKFAERLKEYVLKNEVTSFDVIFHGGEPLLYTAENLVKTVQLIEETVAPFCQLNFSLQTNGTLLTDEVIDNLFTANISISMSLDGPQNANHHRVDHKGENSFNEAFSGLDKLIATDSDLFKGVIAVVDPKVSPKDLFQFFDPLNLPRLDFLLPDSTHLNPPVGRNRDKGLYTNWLLEAFELWFKDYPHIPIRWFDSILASRVGIPSQTDVMGFGDVSLLVVETDGSYTDHDVFKITKPNGASLDGSVFSNSFDKLSDHAVIKEHSYRLSIEGVAEECKKCPVLDACGGGSVPHRYHPERGLDAPTVYCQEIYQVIAKATKLLRESLKIDVEANYSYAVPKGETLVLKANEWAEETLMRARRIADSKKYHAEGVTPAAVLLRAMSTNIVDFDFTREESEPLNWLGSIYLQSNEKWLVEPFKESISVLDRESEPFKYGQANLKKVENYLNHFNPTVLESMRILISDLLFVRSTIENESGIFSFSDDTAPNAIYIAPTVNQVPIPAEDIGDSILHEYLHQVLYHMGREGDFLFDHSFPRFSAPWREGLRSSGGFLHGTFVFTHLALYWEALSDSPFEEIDRTKAENNAKKFKKQAMYGLNSLYHFALLTERGEALIEALAEKLDIQDYKYIEAPGKDLKVEL
jgi:uncharacterized protein